MTETVAEIGLDPPNRDKSMLSKRSCVCFLCKVSDESWARLTASNIQPAGCARGHVVENYAFNFGYNVAERFRSVYHVPVGHILYHL